MKKIIVLFILVTTICSLLTFGTVAYASSTLYFYVANTDIALYSKYPANSSTYRHTAIVPSTYYLQVSSDTSMTTDYIQVQYNGQQFYAKKSDFANNLTKTTITETDNPYYSPNNFDIETISFDLFGFEEQDSPSLPSLPLVLERDMITNIRFISFFSNGDNSFFLVTLKDNGVDQIGYVKASDTNKSDLTLANIDKHPNSILPPVQDPTIQDPNQNAPATNNLIRNILVGVISFLSILVVFLIFKPSKAKKNNRNNYNQPF